MGVIGAVAGTSSTGIITLIKSMMDNSFHRRVSEADRRMQMVASLRSQRDTSIKLWRAGLEHARDAYRRSLEQTPDGSAAPNVVGDEWFETLRPHQRQAGTAGATAPRPTCGATTRRWPRCRWRSGGSSSSGSTRPRAERVGQLSRSTRMVSRLSPIARTAALFSRGSAANRALASSSGSRTAVPLCHRPRTRTRTRGSAWMLRTY